MNNVTAITINLSSQPMKRWNRDYYLNVIRSRGRDNYSGMSTEFAASPVPEMAGVCGPWEDVTTEGIQAAMAFLKEGLPALLEQPGAAELHERRFEAPTEIRPDVNELDF